MGYLAKSESLAYNDILLAKKQFKPFWRLIYKVRNKQLLQETQLQKEHHKKILGRKHETSKY